MRGLRNGKLAALLLGGLEMRALGKRKRYSRCWPYLKRQTARFRRRQARHMIREQTE